MKINKRVLKDKTAETIFTVIVCDIFLFLAFWPFY